MNANSTQKNFSGKFTKEVRRRFLEKRLNLGLTYYRLALFFNLDWTTIRKWELGPTLSCSLDNQRKLQEFLDGVYDHEFTIRGNEQYNPKISNIPPAVRGCLEKIINTYIICRDNQVLTQRLQTDLNSTIRNTLRRLTSTPMEEYARSSNKEYL